MFKNVTWLSLLLLLVIVAVFVGINFLAKKRVSYTVRVLTALAAGILFGLLMNYVFFKVVDVAKDEFYAKTFADLKSWLQLFGNGFVDLLRMLTIPLIVVSIVTAIVKLGTKDSSKFGKTMGIVIGSLVVTVAIAALVGILTANIFKLNANDILNPGQSQGETAQEVCLEIMDTSTGKAVAIKELNVWRNIETGVLVNSYKTPGKEFLQVFELKETGYDAEGNVIKSPFAVTVPNAAYNATAFKQCEYGFNRSTSSSSVKDIQGTIRSFIPAYPFYALTGKDDNATIKTVVFAGFIGIALLAVNRKYPEEGKVFIDAFNAAQKVVMRIVTMVLRLTPYGVFALMTYQIGANNLSVLVDLGKFIIANYVALLIMFVIQLLILIPFKYNPVMYIRKGWSTLVFAFVSRSSAGTLPLTIETQKSRMGVEDGVATAAGSLGTSIGQNGCAGVYPAMLAVMIAASMGINTWSIEWIAIVIFITAVGSFGIAGVGGGATFAAIVVVSALGYDLTIIGVLVAIEAFIDMARTALNVSGSMVSGLITARLTGAIDDTKYNDAALINTTIGEE